VGPSIDDEPAEIVPAILAYAQVHATLALVDAMDELGAELYRIRYAVEIMAGKSIDDLLRPPVAPDLRITTDEPEPESSS
jgi:hypothetical protein